MAKHKVQRAHRPSRNDQRSNVLNSNNPAHKAAVDNRSNQKNPEHPAYPILIDTFK